MKAGAEEMGGTHTFTPFDGLHHLDKDVCAAQISLDATSTIYVTYRDVQAVDVAPVTIPLVGSEGAAGAPVDTTVMDRYHGVYNKEVGSSVTNVKYVILFMDILLLCDAGRCKCPQPSDRTSPRLPRPQRRERCLMNEIMVMMKQILAQGSAREPVRDAVDTRVANVVSVTKDHSCIFTAAVMLSGTVEAHTAGTKASMTRCEVL